MVNKYLQLPVAAQHLAAAAAAALQHLQSKMINQHYRPNFSSFHHHSSTLDTKDRLRNMSLAPLQEYWYMYIIPATI